MGVAVRLPSQLKDRARRIAADMSALSRYELLGISPKTVIRMALVEGADLVNNADPKYLRPEHAATLRDQLQTRINNLNVMLTDGSYVDLVFMSKVVEWGHVRARVDEDRRGKERAIDIQLPPGPRAEVEAAIDKGMKQGIPSRSAMIRILLEAGLVRLEARTYWDQRREGFEDDGNGGLRRPDQTRATSGGVDMQTMLQSTSTFHRLTVHALREIDQDGFEVLVKPDADQPGANREKPTVFRCSDAGELRSCLETLGMDGISRQLGERVDVPVFLHVSCSLEDAIAIAERRSFFTLIASNSTIPEMRQRIAALKATGLTATDHVSI